MRSQLPAAERNTRSVSGIDAPPQPVVVYDKFPQAGGHTWKFMAFGPDGLLYVSVGSPCNICDHTFVENDVVIGDRVTVKCGVQLWDGIAVEDDETP